MRCKNSFSKMESDRMKTPNPYRCRSDTCDTCIYNEECANEILSDRDKGIYLPVPKSMTEFLEE